MYPAYGAFLSAKKFQETTGVGRFVDSAEMKAQDFAPDSFYFDKALKMIESEQGDQPLFIMVYTMFNHFPWWNVVKPELTPDWRALGNDPELDEYLRRQTLSARNYADFKQRLAVDFPGKPFLVVRFGDHQPAISNKLLDPGKLAIWMRPADAKKAKVKVDPRVGGELDIVMHTKSRDLPHKGVYKVIDRGPEEDS